MKNKDNITYIVSFIICVLCSVALFCMEGGGSYGMNPLSFYFCLSPGLAGVICLMLIDKDN